MRGATVGAALAGAVLLATLAAGPGAAPAEAAPDPGPLVLTPTPNPLGMTPIGPGGHVRWSVRTALAVHDTADLFLSIVGHDTMATDPAGLTVEVQRCSGAWSSSQVSPTCSTGDATMIVADAPVATLPADAIRVATLSPGHPSDFLFTLSLPAGAGTNFDDATGLLDLVFTADGDTETVSVGGRSLASTGIQAIGPALIAAGLLGGGLTLGLLRARRRREPRR